MKISKQHVEQSIAAIDKIVDELRNQEGMYSYRSKDLLEYWSMTRKAIARCTARVLTGTAGKEKKAGETVRDYGGEMTDSAPKKKDTSTAIQLGKSLTIQKKKRTDVPECALYINVKNQ